MKRIAYILPLVLLTCGCEYPFDPKLEGMNSEYAVEGHLVSDTVKQVISFFYTKSYQSDNTFEPVTDAEVSVAEWLNGTVTRTFHYSYIDSLKKYISDDAFGGLPGYAYRLHIRKGNDEITATDTMRNKVYMDSIRFMAHRSYKIFNNGSYKEIIILDIVGFAQDPPDLGNAYIWDTYKNDSLLTDSLWKKIFQNDIIGNGVYFKGIQVSYPGLFPVDSLFNTSITPGTVFSVTTSHISNSYFYYLLNVMLSTDWRAGPFSGPPANPEGNLIRNGKKDGVFGYFSAESKTKLTIVFDPSAVIPPDDSFTVE